MTAAQRTLLLTKSLRELKKDAWDVFSQYIRREAADWRGYAQCVTCKRVKHWKELQAGHFIDGRNNAVLFSEAGVHPQCYRCNIPLHGNKLAYHEFMVGEYGSIIVERLKEEARKTVKYSKEDLIGMMEVWVNKMKTFDNG